MRFPSLTLIAVLILAPNLLRAAAGCDSNVLLVQVLSPAAGDTVTAGVPVFVQVQAVDACGNPHTSGVVTARVSNADPLAPFLHAGNGLWRATWVPFNATQPAVSLNAVAAFAQGPVVQSGKADIVVQVAPNSQVPKLAYGIDRVSFTTQQSAEPSTSTVNITNVGGGSLRFTTAARTVSGGNWLAVSPAFGDVVTVATRPITLTATPGSLPEGTYSATVTIATNGGNADIPVSLSVSRPQGRLLLSQAGLTFTAVEGGGNPAPQSFSILNQGSGELTFEARATSLNGGTWLRLNGASGRLLRPLVDVASVEVIPDASRLTAGDYYSEVRVTGSAGNSPQLLTVLLKVLPPGSNPGPEIHPTSLVFIGAPGSTPPAEDVRVTNLLARAVTFNSGALTPGGARWFTYSPSTAGSIPTGTTQRIAVQPNFAGLAPGVRTGTLTFNFDDGTVRNINVVAIVPATAPAPLLDKSGAREIGGCSGVTLRGDILSLPEGSAITVGQPVAIDVKIADECGNLLLGNERNANSAVYAKFSNGDPDLRLTPTGRGIWSGTWRPVGASNGTVIVSAVSVFVQGTFVQAGRSDRSVRVGTGANVPIVVPGSLVHAASQRGDTPVAPGTLVTLYGSDLAGAATATNVPLPTDVNGTQVLLAGQPLPILYSSNSQINAQVPYGLPVNTSHQIVVRRGATLSVPESFTIAAAQPGIFTINQQGTGQGVVMGPDQLSVADPAKPAVRGQAIVIYCTGLGAVTPDVTLGVPAPSNVLSQTVNPVTVSVGGKQAQLLFSGLTPGFTGLYQVNALVPADSPTGNAVDLVISTGGQDSNTVSIAVR